MNDTQRTKNAHERKVNPQTGMLDEVKERFADFTGDVADALKEKGADMWDDIQERGQDTWKDVKTFVRKNPGESMAVAFVAGLLMFALFRRGND